MSVKMSLRDAAAFALAAAEGHIKSDYEGTSHFKTLMAKLEPVRKAIAQHDRTVGVTDINDPNHPDNYEACRTRAKAIEHGAWTWGGSSMVWKVGGEWRVNDGINGETGRRWAKSKRPVDAQFVKHPKQ